MDKIETILGSFFASHPDATDDQIRAFYDRKNLGRVECHEAYTLGSVISARKKLQALRNRPLIPQRSEEWYTLREGLLTASDLAQALGKGKYGNRAGLIQKKAFPSREFAAAKLAPLVWGVRYEAVAAMIYQRMKGGVPLHEFGLIPHETCKVFGASPDGITDTGVMLEIKCPYKRKIIQGDVPEHYALQIQGQLEVCDLEYCDYIECQLKQHTQNEFEDLRDREHVGIVAECYGSGDTYIYSPTELTGIPELLAWKTELYNKMPDTIMCFYYWSLEDYNLVRVKRDRELFDSLRPEIEDFWKDVLKARKEGPVAPKVTRPRKVTVSAPVFSFVEEDEEGGDAATGVGARASADGGGFAFILDHDEK